MHRHINNIVIVLACAALVISAVSLSRVQKAKMMLEAEIADLKASQPRVSPDDVFAARDAAMVGLETRLDDMHATLSGIAVRTGYYPQPMSFDPEKAVEGQRYGSLTLASLTLGP